MHVKLENCGHTSAANHGSLLANEGQPYFVPRVSHFITLLVGKDQEPWERGLNEG